MKIDFPHPSLFVEHPSRSKREHLCLVKRRSVADIVELNNEEAPVAVVVRDPKLTNTPVPGQVTYRIHEGTFFEPFCQVDQLEAAMAFPFSRQASGSRHIRMLPSVRGRSEIPTLPAVFDVSSLMKAQVCGDALRPFPHWPEDLEYVVRGFATDGLAAYQQGKGANIVLSAAAAEEDRLWSERFVAAVESHFISDGLIWRPSHEPVFLYSRHRGGSLRIVSDDATQPGVRDGVLDDDLPYVFSLTDFDGASAFIDGHARSPGKVFEKFRSSRVSCEVLLPHLLEASHHDRSLYRAALAVLVAGREKRRDGFKYDSLSMESLDAAFAQCMPDRISDPDLDILVLDAAKGLFTNRAFGSSLNRKELGSIFHHVDTWRDRPLAEIFVAAFGPAF